MIYKDITEKIIGLKKADLDFRNKLIQTNQLEKSYHKDMEKLHNNNAEILDKIIDEIGYPTIDKVGNVASEASWLVIQHSIGKPAFMKRCLKLLKKAVREDKADPINLAFLTDRIAVFEKKKQLYGTQFDWDKNGKLNPQSFDDLTKVNNRRKSIGLNTLEEQTEIIRKRAKAENQSSPKDFDKREKEFMRWKKKVGWI